MSDVKITEIQGRGRAVIASKTIKAGQIILRESPILVYPAVHSSKNCSNCFRKLHLSTTTTPCPSCSDQTLFCSPTCQTLALSSSHSPWFCETLSRLRSSFPSLNPDLQTQANFLISACNLAVVSPPDFQLILSLHGNAAAVPTEETLLLHSFISSSQFAGVSLELTAALLAKDKHNAFGLMEPFEENGERSVRAYAIYPTASFFNHDCLPNACRFDYVDSPSDRNTDIVVRALHDISEGREICLSYFPVNWSYPDRQRRLMEDYGFACTCDRCGVEKNWRDEEEDGDESMASLEEECVGEGEGDDFPHSYFFVGYLCDRENCGGTLAPLPPSQGKQSDVMECNVCGKLRKEEEVDGDDVDEDGVMLDE